MVETIFTRIKNKTDLEIILDADDSFIPLRGEVVVYDSEVDSDGSIKTLSDGTPCVPVTNKNGVTRTIPYTYTRVKIGDGFTCARDLPFASSIVKIVTWEEND